METEELPEARIALRVQPRARRNQVSVSESGVVTVRVSAAPERGRANAAVVEALAEALQVPPSSVEIARGHASRDKVVLVEGLALEEAMRRLQSVSGEL